jgi:DNA-binding transcriptional MerR regulator
MNKITFPLNPGMVGEAVVNLQDGLLLLLKSYYSTSLFKPLETIVGIPKNGSLQKIIAFLKRERKEKKYSAITKGLVGNFQNNNTLKPTGVVDKATATLLNEILRELGLLDNSDDEQKWKIRGRIISHEYRGLEDYRVQLLDKNVDTAAQLDESKSGKGGTYQFILLSSSLNKKNPDIQVQVVDGNNNVLGTSKVHYNISSDITGLDVFIAKDMVVQLAEYQQLLGALSTHLDKPISELKEDDQHQDITYLANKSGWDARMIAMIALANQFSAKSGIEPEFYYALFRAGIPANETALTQMKPETVAKAWKQAIEQHVLPSDFENKIQENLERFKTYSANQLLEESEHIGISGFKDLIKNVLVEPVKQQKFAQLYYDKRNNLEGFWDTVASEFPNEVEGLRLNSQLGFLTTNNAPLINKLRTQHSDLETPLDLVKKGLYQQQAWEQVLDDSIPVPDEIAGEQPEEKRANYATDMAEQLRISYPTAVISQKVRDGTLELKATQSVKTAVTQFLDQQQGNFELGIHPVEDYLNKNSIDLEPSALNEVKKLQRVLQISPSEQVMTTLIKNDLDSAYAITRFDEQTFLSTYSDELGGKEMAKLTYAKAHEAHHFVVNVATSYFIDRSKFFPYAFDNLPASKAPVVSGVIASTTLEELMSEMDYCSCEHCRSWLSPAAYLTDLLLFLDWDDIPWRAELNKWRSNHSETPYPFLNQQQWRQFRDNWQITNPGQELPNTELKPLDIFLDRRPDIQHVQLSCENTNTVLPYIDLVNEVLEHHVINGSLALFPAYNIEDGISMEELLANPQFVSDKAYDILAGKPDNLAGDPPLLPPTSTLPFHKSLETVRRYFDYFDIPLHEAMERLRVGDKLERSDNIEEDSAFGWEDILMERMQLSRAEYSLLTDSTKRSLPRLYGFANNSFTEKQLVTELSHAKKIASLLNISYEELIEIIRTQFINPHSDLIPKLEKLGVNFTTIKALLNGNANAEETLKASKAFADLDIRQYGGRTTTIADKKFKQLKKWLQNNNDAIMGLIVLTDRAKEEVSCSFDTVQLGYVQPGSDQKTLRPIEFLKLLRFIRLWRKLGWSIEHVDKAITAFYPDEQIPEPTKDYTAAGAKLDVGFRTLLIRLAHLHNVMQQLKLSPKRDLTSLLACWSPIDTQGRQSLYHQMFLNSTVLGSDGVFDEDGYGHYLNDENKKLIEYTDTLRGAFNLSQTEFNLILEEERLFDDKKTLNLANISVIYRHAYLARKLRISMQEFLALKSISGLDPFQTLDLSQPPNPADVIGSVRPQAIRFIELVQQINDSPIDLAQLRQLLSHVNPEHAISPVQQDIQALALLLRNDLSRIKHEKDVQDDPKGDITEAKMALVYGEESTNLFFGLLNHSLSFSVSYSQPEANLENTVLAVTDRIAYDDFKKQLSIQGVMTEAEKDTFNGIAGVTPEFKAAINNLFDKSQAVLVEFFERYSELEVHYLDFVNTEASVSLNDKFKGLLNDILPLIRSKLQQQQVYQTLSAKVGADVSQVKSILDNVSILHTVDVVDDPAIKDFLRLEEQGLSADIFFADTVLSGIPVATINYQTGDTSLPLDPTNRDSAISGVWRGLLQAPDNGFYNFYINADAGAEIHFNLDGKEIELTVNSGIWENQSPVELEVGRLYELELKAEQIKDVLILEWERTGMGRTLIPSAQLYPKVTINRFTATYLRLLKILGLVETLALSSTELEHFASHEDYIIEGESWLNVLPATISFSNATTQGLLSNIIALLNYRSLKQAFNLTDDSFIALLQDPLKLKEKIEETADDEPLLNFLTSWKEPDLADLLKKFGILKTKLTHLEYFIRLYDAFDVVDKLGISATALFTHTSNEPDGESLRAMQATLRARYDQQDWLKIIQPINDKMRSLQRDALVDYVLHQMQQDEVTQHINSTEKLFELFLIDVQMDPCMKTSRIKQAISSVQLFVQRCLLNLEPQVASSAIKAKQWEWMKRYRVWEANRKVFLWPENWLEPELRDNKSPFFKDLESELLQSDITNDAAATALVHYLEKLDEVAKLEICGMYYEEDEVDNEADTIVHVIARTPGARRTYYYRRQNGGVSWSPWEKIELNIEDNPVIPVVWKGRLFLFWVSVLQEASQESNSDGNGDTPLANMNASQLQDVAGEAKTRVTVMLYWSEYYNQKWQPARTSDINNPLVISDFDASGGGVFDREKLELSTFPITNPDRLSVFVSYRQTDYIFNSFGFHNHHSSPIPLHSEAIQGSDLIEVLRKFTEQSSPFNIKNALLPNHQILNRVELYRVVAPRHLVKITSEAPFFFQDQQNVFFVKPVLSQVSIGESLDIGQQISFPGGDQETPPITVIAIPDIQIIQDIQDARGAANFPPELDTGFTNPGKFHNFTMLNPNIIQTIEPTEPFRFGGVLISQSGMIDKKKLSR